MTDHLRKVFEASRLANLERLEDHRRGGFKRFEWLTAEDEHTCKWCAAKSGRVVTPATAKKWLLNNQCQSEICRCMFLPVDSGPTSTGQIGVRSAPKKRLSKKDQQAQDTVIGCLLIIVIGAAIWAYRSLVG